MLQYSAKEVQLCVIVSAFEEQRTLVLRSSEDPIDQKCPDLLGNDVFVL